jgi:hypothetical protein
LWPFFLCFPLQVEVAASAGEEEGRISPAACFSRRRVNPRAASGGGAWNNTPPLFLLSFGFTELVPALLWILNGCFVIFFNVIFV